MSDVAEHMVKFAELLGAVIDDARHVEDDVNTDAIAAWVECHVYASDAAHAWANQCVSRSRDHNVRLVAENQVLQRRVDALQRFLATEMMARSAEQEERRVAAGGARP
jgi:hypothetical protein